jgi:hypothetical protein
MNERKVSVVLTNTNFKSFLDILTSNRKIVPMIIFITKLKGCATERRRAAVAKSGKYIEFILVNMKYRRRGSAAKLTNNDIAQPKCKLIGL